MTSEYLIPKPRLPIRHLITYGWMPGALKKIAYRMFLGYRIGKGVKLGFGCAVVGRDVVIGENVDIGFFTIIRGQRIRVGRCTQIGSTSYLMCDQIEIGEDAKINEQVFVGGPMLPESLFHLGDRTTVMQMSFLNPTKPLVIGDDSGIGGHCLIFTHGSWLNVLDGYPVTFDGVTIGGSVWLPWRVFVMPGATIRDGSVIGANSLVQGEIPARSLAVGSPARVVKTFPDFPRQLDEGKRSQLVEEMLKEFDRFVRHAGIEAGPDGRYTTKGAVYTLLRVRSGDPAQASLGPNAVVLAECPLNDDWLDALRRNRSSWLDLAGRRRCKGGNPLCEELALFLSRYGIRLKRDA